MKIRTASAAAGEWYPIQKPATPERSPDADVPAAPASSRTAPLAFPPDLCCSPPPVSGVH